MNFSWLSQYPLEVSGMDWKQCCYLALTAFVLTVVFAFLTTKDMIKYARDLGAERIEHQKTKEELQKFQSQEYLLKVADLIQQMRKDGKLKEDEPIEIKKLFVH